MATKLNVMDSIMRLGVKMCVHLSRSKKHNKQVHKCNYHLSCCWLLWGLHKILTVPSWPLHCGVSADSWLWPLSCCLPLINHIHVNYYYVGLVARNAHHCISAWWAVVGQNLASSPGWLFANITIIFQPGDEASQNYKWLKKCGCVCDIQKCGEINMNIENIHIMNHN